MSRPQHRHDVFHRGKVPEDQLGTGTATDGHVLTATATGEAAWEAGGSAATDAHIADTSDAHDASAVSVADAGGYYTGTDVEAVLQELGSGAGGHYEVLM